MKEASLISKTFNDQEQDFDHDEIELNWSEATYPEYKIYTIPDAELVIPEFEDERQEAAPDNIVRQYNVKVMKIKSFTPFHMKTYR